MTHAYIIDAVRTPRTPGKQTGALHEVKPIELGAGLLRELEARHDFDTAYVDDVKMGCTGTIGEQGADVAKTIALHAGWDESVPGIQMDRYCASGLDAVNMAAQTVMSGWSNLVVGGGVESMSRVPMGMSGGAILSDPEFVTANASVPQGVSADLVATLAGFTREQCDEYALASQQRAAHARDNGYFDKSVVPVKDLNGVTIVERDTYLKPDTTLDKLAGLRPAFARMGAMGMDDHVLRKFPQLSKIDHVHTPGNSSGIVDGASAVLIANDKAVKDQNLTPRGRVVAGAVVASDPTLMFHGPGPAARKALATAGLSPEDIDLWELNEAFASAVLKFMQDMDLDHEQINVVGGAIAMGHPLGATGAILISTMLDELERQNKKRALLALCAAGGIGIATIIERL